MSYPLQPCMRLDLDFCLHNVPLLRSSHLWSGILHKCAFRAHEEKFATARSEGWRPDHSPLERRMDACHTLFRIESQKLTILKNQEIFIILDNTYCLTEIIVHPVIFRTQIKVRTCLSQGLALMMPKYGNYYNLTNQLYQVLFTEFFQTTPSEFSDCFSETDKSSSSPVRAIIFYYCYC